MKTTDTQFDSIAAYVAADDAAAVAPYLTGARKDAIVRLVRSGASVADGKVGIRRSRPICQEEELRNITAMLLDVAGTLDC